MWKKTLMAMLIAVMTITVTGCGAENDDAALLEAAEEAAGYLGEPDETYAVTKIGENYKVTVNGQTTKIVLSDAQKDEEIDNLVKEQSGSLKDARVQKIFQQSLEKVENYVDNSELIKHKKRVLKQLENLAIVSCRFKEQGTAGMCKDGAIFIDEKTAKNMPEFWCQWCFCHEMLHALSDITHEAAGPKTFYGTQFDEALTDIITAFIIGDVDDVDLGSIESGYARYFEYILAYIGVFQEQALKAYFYGYDTIYNQVGQNEFDFFVKSFEQLDNAELAHQCFYASLCKWKAKS